MNAAPITSTVDRTGESTQTGTSNTAQQVQDAAEQALQLMRQQGFEHAQASVSALRRSELCVAHNEASLLRSTDGYKLQLVGLLDGRRAACEASSFDTHNLQSTVQTLWASVASAPQDEANAVSSGQQLQHVRGTAAGSPESINNTLAQTMADLLAWREAHTPTVMLEDALAGHNHKTSCTLTSRGSMLSTQQSWFDATAFGLAREVGPQGAKNSSFNEASGTADTLHGLPVHQRFGIEAMLRQLVQQVHTQPFDARFQGAVVLTPPAVASLLAWLLGQLADQALIDGSSVYLQLVGLPVAARALTLKSRFDAPGVAPLSADGFVAAPVELITQGRLNTLTPSLYGSAKTGLPHVPVAAQGWDLAAGCTPLAEMVAAVPQGALVDRLSMGRPASNGDFSGVIKNSFAIHNGQLGHALSETMIAGNVAQMLRNVQAASAERIDTGGWVLPWLLVPGLHFS